MVTLILYPKCSTSQKAKRWLEHAGVAFDVRDIVKNTPTESELQSFLDKANKPLKRFFNTSGQSYRKLGLKDDLPTMSKTEALSLLASDGMLIKRPLLIDGDTVLIGFKVSEYEAHFNDEEGLK